MNVIYSGQTSDREVLEVVNSQHGDYRFDSLRSVLHDFSGIDGCHYSGDTLEYIASLGVGASRANARLRIAIVSGRKDVIAMVERFQEVGLNTYPMQMFRTVADARAWLEMQP